MRPRTVVPFAIVSLAAAGAGFLHWSSQHADFFYRPQLEAPAFTATHPVVTIDEAHYEAHTAGGLYAPFVRLLEADGFTVRRGEAAFTAESLSAARVLVIVNAAGASRRKFLGVNLDPEPPADRGAKAFTAAEVEAVRQWVEAGGSLLLIADHHPFGSAAAELAAAFGVTMNQGFVDAPKSPADVGNGDLLFSRDNGLLADHPITRGRTEAERVNRVMTFTGQSLDGPAGTSLLTLPPTAVEAVPPGPQLTEIPAGGKSQAMAFQFQKGRVVVLGEAGMLTAQVSAGRSFGLNIDGHDNRQFALNLMHWLAE
jgi:hypothetical protein